MGTSTISRRRRPCSSRLWRTASSRSDSRSLPSRRCTTLHGQQHRLLLQRTHRRPERLVHRFGQRLLQRVQGVGMAGMTAVANRRGVVDLPKAALAIRADEGAGLGNGFEVRHELSSRRHQLHLVPQALGPGCRRAFGQRRVHQRNQQFGHCIDREPVIDRNIAQRAFGHAGRLCVGRLLNHRDAAARLDRLQAGGAVFHGSAQHDADHAGSPRERGGKKQWVEGGACVVFLGAAVQVRHIAVEHQVHVRRRDVDVPGQQLFTVHRVRGWQPAARRQQLRQHARMTAGVKHHEQRRREVLRQTGDQRGKRGHAADGRACDHDASWRCRRRRAERRDVRRE